MLTIEAKGVKELGEKFEYVRRGLVDFRQLGTWKAVAAEAYKVIESIFANEGGASGQWAPLKPKYEAIKRAAYGDQPILTASGVMRRSLTSSNAPGSVYSESKDEVVIGSTDKKVPFHQYGTSRMKKRPIFDFSAAHKEQMTEPIYRKLKQLIANARLREARGL